MTKRFKKRLVHLFAGGAAAFAVTCNCGNGFAQTDATWTGGGDGTTWSDADNWDSVLFPNGIFNVTIDGDAGTDTTVQTGTSQTINIDSLTVDTGDTLVIQNASSFGIVTDAGRPGSGVINNDGSIQITNAFNNTNLVIDGEVNLNGNGTVTLGGGSGTTSRIIDNSGDDGHFINNGNTIEGMGQVGVDSLQLTNHGTIDANVSGQSLVLDPNAIGMSNDGVMKASNGGRLGLRDGSFDNTGGSIEAGDASTVALFGSAVISGGTLTSTGTGSIEVESSQTATISNVTNAGTINQRNNSDFFADGNIDNQGEINIINGFNNTEFIVDTNTELSGGGTLTLGGPSSSASRIVDQSGADGVITNVDNTIQGIGQFGVDSLEIVNQANGLISANDSAGSLTINPSTGDLTNDGVMNATAGGQLILTGNGGGQFNNGNGVIEAQDASTVRLTGIASVVGGELKTNGTGQILVGQTDNAELHDLNLNGTLNVLNNSDLELFGTIENQGTINLSNGFNDTDIQIEGDVTLNGGGTVTLGGSSSTASRILDEVGTADGKLTNVDNTIQGAGAIGLDRMTMVNQSTIDSNEAGRTLTIDPRDDGVIDFTNNGTLKASNEGTLILSGNNGGQFLNSGGLIEAGVDSKVKLTGVAAIVGGDLVSVGTGQIEVGSTDNAELHDVNFSGQMNVLNNTDLELFGTLNNTGAINLTNGFNDTDLQIESSVSLTGGGTITLGGSNNASRILDEVDSQDGVFTNVDNTIQGKGQIGVNRTEINNQGVIDANDSSNGGSITLNPRDSGIEFTNTGTLRASSGGELVLSGSGGGRFLNSGGTIEALDGSTVRLANVAHVDGGMLKTSGTGKFAVGPTQNAELKDLTFDGLMEVSNNTDVELVGTINNLGEIVVTNGFNDTDIQVEGPVSLTGGGSITLGGGSATATRILDEVGPSDGVLTNFGNTIRGVGRVGVGSLQIFNEAGGTIHANVGGGTLEYHSRLGNTNSGTFRASNGGILEIVGGVLNSGTLQADMASLITADSVTNQAAGSLIGNGEIESMNILNDGRIAPGASVGHLTLDGDVTFGDTSLLDIEIDMSGADLLTIMGSASLDGDLSLNLLSGYLPMDTDTFTILTTDSLSGVFDNVANGDMLLTSDGSGSFIVNYGLSSSFAPNSVVLSGFTASVIPEPGSAIILVGLGVAALSRRRRD